MRDRNTRPRLGGGRDGNMRRRIPPAPDEPAKLNKDVPRSDFEDLFGILPCAALIIGVDGDVVDSNGRAECLFLYTVDEFRALAMQDLIWGLDKSFMDTIRANLEDRFLFIESCYCIRKDKSLFHAEISVNTLRRHEDQQVWFIRDITGREGVPKDGDKAGA